MTHPAALAGPPLPYAKMNGIGNAILVLDLRGRAALDGAAAAALAQRPGFDFDQVMAIRDPVRQGNAAFVDILNRDGSQAGACGNGTRCVAWFLLEGAAPDAVAVETAAGVLDCRREAPTVFTVAMGRPGLGWHDVPLRDAIPDTRAFRLDPSPEWITALGPASAVGMGNPHAIFWLAADAPALDLAHLGPALEHHPMFPERANISFARVLAPDRIRLDVWERGAGLTLACGSAACATLVAAVRTGRSDRRADILLPGGTLTIAWEHDDAPVEMTGSVTLEHRGDLMLGTAAVPA